MFLYQRLAENLQFIVPGFYKKRYFKHLKNSSKENYSVKNIEPELIWIKDFLPRNAVIIDIGANVGSFIYQLEKKLLPENIFAFEPNKKLFSRLKRIFPEVEIHPFAISDTNGMLEFKIPIINGKKYNSRGTLIVNYRENDEEKHITEKVKVIKLDDWEKINKFPKLDFIKIDVEGNEMKTLYGAKETIKKHKPILMVEMEQRHHNKPLFEMISEIESWDYSAHFLNRNNFEVERINENIILQQSENILKNKEQYINNIIFLPKNKLQ